MPHIAELHLTHSIVRSVTAGIAVAAATPGYPLVSVNPAFEAMTGYSSAEIMGWNCRFLQGPEQNQPGVALIREALANKREITTVLKNFRKDGSFFWNELHLSPIFSLTGELTHFVGIQKDITARIDFEAALRESEKLAAVGRLASSIAHEINNPLESIMNLIYLAERTEDLAEIRLYLATADLELQRVKLITTQSLRFFKQSTRPLSLDAPAVLSSVLDMHQSRLHNAHIVTSQRHRFTRSVLCMESEIRQVLNNLISNAIDAMAATGGRLMVRTRNATDPRSGRLGILITVADTGSGMSPETLARMYTAFYTTKGERGTGLGLWITHGIVARHQGRLRVRSSQAPDLQQHGTVFQLFLPHEMDPDITLLAA